MITLTFLLIQEFGFDKKRVQSLILGIRHPPGNGGYAAAFFETYSVHGRFGAGKHFYENAVIQQLRGT
jgi:hypothetical protein